MHIDGTRIERDVFEQTQVCVAGAGLAGAAVAMELARAGAAVVLLEQGPRLEEAAGPLARIPAEVLRGWQDELRLDFLGPRSLDPIFEQLEALFPVERLPLAAPGAVQRGAELLGLGGRRLPRLRPEPQGLLSRASEAGARIYTGCRVERILTLAGEATGVEAWFVEAGTGRPRARLDLSCSAVVLCAGALQSAVLLGRSRLGGARLGRNLALQPTATVTGHFEEAGHTVVDSAPSFLVEDLRGEGILLEALSEGLQSSSLGVTVIDEGRGRVRRNGRGQAALSGRMSRADRLKLVRGLASAAEILFAAGASTVELPLAGRTLHRPEEIDRLLRSSLRSGQIRQLQIHPMGACRIGEDPQDAVVRPDGELHGLDGLFVAGGLTFPAPPQVPLPLPVLAFSVRIVPAILRRLDRKRGPI